MTGRADTGREEGKRSRRALAIALAAIDRALAGEPLALCLSEALRAAPEAGPRERRTAAATARALLRELRRVDAALALALPAAGVRRKALSAPDLTLARYLALRVSIEREPPARPLGELRLPFAPRSFTLGEAALAGIARALPDADALPVPADPVEALALRRSVPDHLARRLADELGLGTADALLAGLNEPARLDLRANRLLATRDELAVRLGEEGVETRPCALAPDGLVAADRAGLFGRAHATGLFELQDEGSQLLAALCAAPAGALCIDWCAGAGGKTLALAAQVGRGGRVLACDADGRRLAGLAERARRARADGIVEASGTAPAQLRGRADVVLVDAPCSGLGGMRREPDLRWRVKPADLDGFPARQLRILQEAAGHVRPGGRLVYGTCSPLRAEDEEVVRAFLDRNHQFRLLDAATLAGAGAAEGGFLRTWPHLHGTGAFFGAALERLPDADGGAGTG